MKFSRFIRILHTLLATGIVLTLLSSLVMKTPKPDQVLTSLQSFGYEAHEMAGMAVFVVLALHWIVFVSGHAYKGVEHFFPWFSKTRMQTVLSDIRELLRLKVGDPEQEDYLSSAFQGLGLIVGSILAASGAVLVFGIAKNGAMSAPVHALKEFHEFWGPIMWGYLGIHVGATVLHIAFGHRPILSIFRW